MSLSNVVRSSHGDCISSVSGESDSFEDKDWFELSLLLSVSCENEAFLSLLGGSVIKLEDTNIKFLQCSMIDL